jgi:hypothetical protein
MISDFDKIALFGSFCARSYARDILGVLYTYQDVSASEAASRLGLHIKTVQEFLEAMYHAGFAAREEVYQKKRPYFRYKLASEILKIEINLHDLFGNREPVSTDLKIRERANSFTTFNRARHHPSFSSIVIFVGTGRERKEKRISLTQAQGTFLYNLPFPDGQFKSIGEIMHTAQIGQEHLAEIMDIINLLMEHGVIEPS